MFALLSDLIDSQHSLGSYHDLGFGLYESIAFSRLRKCPLPPSFQLKITPPPPPAQCCWGWFKECFLLSQQVGKIKSNIFVKWILNSSGTEDFLSMSPKKSTIRRQYLVTYSKANMTNFPMRETFEEAVVTSFTLSGKVIVQHWVCCLEEHENTSGQHYHMCVKLSGPKRWNPVKNHLMPNHQIVVNFSESHETYYTAYKYVCKKNCNVIHS